MQVSADQFSGLDKIMILLKKSMVAGRDLNCDLRVIRPDELPGCSTRDVVSGVWCFYSLLLKEKVGARDGSRTRDFQLGSFRSTN